MNCPKCGVENSDTAQFCQGCGLSLGNSQPVETVLVEAVQDELEGLREAVKDVFAITAELGRGGMAVVYQARDLKLNRQVALKVLPRELTFDKKFVERFKQEIQTLAQLEHPNIIPLYSADERGGYSFFSMKYVRGRSLTDIITEKGKLPVAETLKIARSVCKGLRYAHGEGVVHRDLKPDNIMIDNDGHVYIMDFGIAKALAGAKMTRTGTTVGTVNYMSPEQCSGSAELDGRSDLYSLGIILYEMLAGKPAFDGETTAVMYKQVHENPAPITTLNADVPRDVAALLERLLAKDRDRRPADAGELASELEALERGASAVKAGKRATAPKKAPGRPSDKGKSKGGAVTLAIFFGIYSWLYTYRRDRNKFWLALTITAVANLIILLNLPEFGSYTSYSRIFLESIQTGSSYFFIKAGWVLLGSLLSTYVYFPLYFWSFFQRISLSREEYKDYYSLYAPERLEDESRFVRLTRRGAAALVAAVVIFLLGEGLLGSVKASSLHKRVKQASYQDNRDGTVTDKGNGLMWTKSGYYQKRKSREEALQYVKKLRTGGYKDWRLPTAEEFACHFKADYYTFHSYFFNDIKPRAWGVYNIWPVRNY